MVPITNQHSVYNLAPYSANITNDDENKYRYDLGEKLNDSHILVLTEINLYSTNSCIKGKLIFPILKNYTFVIDFTYLIRFL